MTEQCRYLVKGFGFKRIQTLLYKSVVTSEASTVQMVVGRQSVVCKLALVGIGIPNISINQR